MIKIVIYYFQQELQGINFKPNYKPCSQPLAGARAHSTELILLIVIRGFRIHNLAQTLLKSARQSWD